jgi:ankyrin repeat protein
MKIGNAGFDYCYSGEEYDECYPLMLAAQLGSVPIAELLLEFGADPGRRNARGDTALHFTGRSSSRDEGPAVVARMLCERGADPEARNRSGQAPLASTHATDLAEVLIGFGASPTLNHAIRLRMLDL